MNGKRGEIPPLPRNCKRLLTSARSHCPSGREGAGKLMCVASQETGPLGIFCPLFRGRRRTPCTLFVRFVVAVLFCCWFVFRCAVLHFRVPKQRCTAGSLSLSVPPWRMQMSLWCETPNR